jgi:ABC-type branched-subunit amino acid transport system substrate-binding protein
MVVLVLLWAVSTKFAKAETDKKTIAAIIPLSGDIAAWGQNVKRGIELALHDSKNIEIIYEDESFCNSALALSAAQKIVSNKQTKILITGCLNGTKVITPLAKREDLLLLSGGLLSGEEHGETTQHLLSLSGQIQDEGKELAKLVARRGFQKLAFIRYDDEFTAAVARALSGEEKGPKEILDFPVPANLFDLTPILLKAKQKGADSLLVYVGEKQILSLMRQRSQIGFSVPVFSGYIIESNAFPANERKLLEGIVYTYPRIANKADPLRASLEDAYHSAYGNNEKPSSNTYFVYDGIKILQQSLQKCEVSDIHCIRKFFVENSPFSGSAGQFRFNENGFVERQFLTKEVRDGQFVEVEQ